MSAKSQRQRRNQRRTNQSKSRSNAPARRPVAPAKAAPRPEQHPLFPLPQSVTAEIQIREQFSGPIPPPEVLDRYNQVMPGLGGEIVQMAKDEQAHRHRIVEQAVQANIDSDRRGQYLAFGVAIAGLIVALVLGIVGQAVAAAIVGGIDLVALVGLFLKVRNDERKQQQADPQ